MLFENMVKASRSMPESISFSPENQVSNSFIECKEPLTRYLPKHIEMH